jgi:cell division transport system permease protein
MIKKVVITVKYSVLSYLIKEGFKSVFKNKKATIASLGTMCATMFIFGIFFALGENINYFVKGIQEDQAIRVNIKKTATDEEIETLKEEIQKISGVNAESIQLQTEEEGMDSMKEQWGDNAYVLDAFDPKILPKAYIVRLTDLELNLQVQDEIMKLNNVSSITNANQTISTLVGVANGIRIVTITLLVLLILISIFIISNTIKLTVHARRKEISIMKYVGATNGFIRFPFVIEGIIIGLVAGAITILLLGLAYNGIMPTFANSEISINMGISIVSFAELFSSIVTVYMILGIGIGVLGSSISMRKYLEV